MRTAVITGVSRGLGAALFDQLHARGDRVVAIGRRFTAEQEELAVAEPHRVVLRTADLARPESAPRAPELREWLAGSTFVALVHNAATVQPIGAIGALPSAAVVAAVSANLTAPMLLSNAFLAALPDGVPATVLFLSSGAAHRVIGGWAVYGATKRGGEAFFEALADQVAAAGPGARVRVVSVNPGVMDTGMQASIRDAATRSDYFPEADRFLRLHRDGDLADPASVARALVSAHLSPSG
jgi:NAD(P)-dependent dehydrogenase (short-subunit alcohol dehydrogenase family)